MKKIRQSKLAFTVMLSVAALIITAVYLNGKNVEGVGKDFSIINQASAAKAKPTVSPVKASGGRGTYYPNTEDLAPDEMRIISLGTGMPNPRPSQKATCWLVELGNGDKFLFDLGTGSSDNLAALLIPYDYLDKVFLSHLHTDHFGDFGALI